METPKLYVTNYHQDFFGGTLFMIHYFLYYRQTSNISHALVGNEIIDHSVLL